jgi:hypothetical protein
MRAFTGRDALSYDAIVRAVPGISRCAVYLCLRAMVHGTVDARGPYLRYTRACEREGSISTDPGFVYVLAERGKAWHKTMQRFKDADEALRRTYVRAPVPS